MAVFSKKVGGPARKRAFHIEYFLPERWRVFCFVF